MTELIKTKKLPIALFGLIFTLLFPVVSLAQCTGKSCQSVTIDRFYATTDFLYIGTSDDENKLNCSPTESVYLTLPTTHNNYDLISTLLLTAHESQHPVRVRISEGSQGCLIRYVVSDK